MSSSRQTINSHGEGEGWGSMLLKVAGVAAATVAVAGSLYSLLKQPEPAPAQAHAPPLQFGNNYKEPVVWTRPKFGWVKLNVDGSLWPQSAGCGGVLRDASGKWICGFAQKLNSNYRLDETEKEAILIGLKWAWNRGERKVLIESDNKVAVDLVVNDNNGRRRSNNDPLIREIKHLLSRDDWQAKLIWIHRDANQVADKLAGKAHSFDSLDLVEFISPPDHNCRNAFFKDGCALN